MLNITSLLADMNFWVLVSFVGFSGIAFRPLKQNLFKMLDERSTQIKDELYEAQQMQIEAGELLQRTKENHRQVMVQIEEIFELAEKEVIYLQEKKEEEKKFFLTLKEHLLSHRIEHNRRKVQEEIRNYLVAQAFEEIQASLCKAPQDISASPLFLDRFKKALEHFQG